MTDTNIEIQNAKVNITVQETTPQSQKPETGNENEKMTPKDIKRTMLICGAITFAVALVWIIASFLSARNEPIFQFWFCIAWSILGYSIITLGYAWAKAGPYFEKPIDFWNLIGALIFFPITLFIIIYFICHGVSGIVNDALVKQKMFYFICFLMGLVSRTVIEKFGLGG